MGRGFILFVLILISLAGFSQDFPSEMWHKGKLVLLSEDTVYGKVKYDLQNDAVQINVKNVLQLIFSGYEEILVLTAFRSSSSRLSRAPTRVFE